jgi:hypothetical protein
MSLPEPAPNKALHLTAYSVRFQQQVSASVLPQGGRNVDS